MSYLHGIEIKEGEKRSITTTGETSIIALVGTAPKGDVGKVKLITSIDAARSVYGEDISGFTIPSALETIFSYINAKVLVVNVLSPDKAAALLEENGTMTRDDNGAVATNIYKTSLPEVVDYTTDIVKAIDSLLQIDDTIALKPNIIIAPGYSQLAPVLNKLSEVATKLQGFAVADIIADDVQAALAARASGVFNTVSQAVVLCYPTIERYNAHENTNDLIAISVHWAAAKVLRDTQKGYWLSPSNTELVGVLGLTAKITSSLTDSTADTNLLNGQGIVTVFRKSGSGTRLWGNWTAAFPSDKTTTAMIAPRAVRMAIREALIDSSLDRLDRNVTQIVIDLIVEDVNAFIRTLVGGGVIIDGECLYDVDKNSSSELAQGKITFTYYVKFAPSTERITFEEIVEF